MVEPWQLLATREGFSNRWLHVTLDTARLPDGNVYDYTTIRRHKAGAAVALLNPQGQLLLEQEYRLPVDQVIWQLPGGLVDPGEDPAAGMRRELAEETGLLAGELRHLGVIWNNAAASDGCCHIYLCRDFRATGATRPDQAEFITWGWYDLAWVKARVADGVIRDRVVVCALAYLWLAGEIA